MDFITILTVIFFVLTCLCVAISLLTNLKFGNVSAYWVVSLVGATIIAVVNYKSAGNVFGSLIVNSAINPLKILVFFLSMTIFSIVLDKLNFFKFVASKCVKFAKNNQFKLFFIFYVLVSVLTIFTSNDIVVLAFVPFICYFCKASNINPMPYVFSTFVGANTWSMIFVIGNPTNVYVASYAGIGFFEYFLIMTIPTIVCGVISFCLLSLVFKKQLSSNISFVTDEETIIDKPLVVLNAVMLLSCIVLLAISSYINLEMWYIALGFLAVDIIANLIVCVVTKRDKIYLSKAFKSAPWTFVPFLISMFLIVMCLQENNISAILFNLLGDGSIYLYGIFSFLLCNIMNNIPMTAFFTSVLAQGGSLSSFYAVIMGSNLGALLTPIGALAGIMFINILKEKQIDFSIKHFIKYGAIISFVSLLCGLVVLSFMF